VTEKWIHVVKNKNRWIRWKTWRFYERCRIPCIYVTVTARSDSVKSFMCWIEWPANQLISLF